jgi:hypothetical protein
MSDVLQILERVNGFYSGAFSQLVTFTVGLLALVGVLVPLVIASYQNRQLKHDKKTLSDKMDNDLSALKILLSEQLAKDLAARDDAIKALIDGAKKEIAAEIEKIDALGTARSLHLQALSNQTAIPASAAYDCLSAISSYAKGNDERNLQSVLHIFKDCVEKLSADDLKTHDFEAAAEAAVKALNRLNTNRRYMEDIRDIRRGIEAAKGRKPETE